MSGEESAEALAALALTPPPQANGELSFEAPWQSRVFGMTHQLVDAGVFTWARFQQALIEALDQGAAPAEHYYVGFLAALESCLAEATAEADLSGLLDGLQGELAARPHGHDHGPGHGHHH